MNFQKLLKNPIAVAALCTVAAIFLYFNMIAPLIFPEAGEEILPEIAELTEYNSGEPHENSNNAQYHYTPSDTSSFTLLKKIGWKRTGTRDPFINEKRNGPILTVEALIRNDTDDAVFTKKPVDTSIKVVHSLPAILRAISIGSHTKVALIGTRELHEGDRFVLGRVLKIGPDSVQIESTTGLRTIHLKK